MGFDRKAKITQKFINLEKIDDFDMLNYLESNKLSLIRRSSTGWFIEPSKSNLAYSTPREAILAEIKMGLKK